MTPNEATGIPVEHLRAMIRLLGNEEMTPTARRHLTQLCDFYDEDASGEDR